jgi:opacity protein-like surface antigen
MKRSNARVWTYLAAFTMLTVGLAAGQTMPSQLDTVPISVSRLGFGAQISYFRSSGADEGAYYFGGVVRYRIGQMLGFEGTLGYRGGQVFDFGTVSGNQLFANIATVPLTASVMVFLPLRTTSFVPYALLGVGAYMLSIDYSPDINKVMGDETKIKAGGHLGVGIELPLAQAFTAHADYRYLFLSKIFESGAAYDFSSKDYDGGAITLGLMFFF